VRSAEESGAARDPGLEAAVPFRFACHRCARCCSAGTGHVWVEEHECAPLAHALGMTVEAFAARHLRRVADPRPPWNGRTRLALREAQGVNGGDRGGRCALLVGLNECSVYGARPEHCRTFPYWPSVLAGGQGFESARATCPGIAVVVAPERAAPAHDALARLYDDVGAPPARATCCLDDERAEELFATALEADHAARETAAAREREPRDAHACRLGDGAPLACRTDGDRERFARAFERLRAIEREHGYPAAYGRLRELLRSRGVERDAGKAARA
jgi:Fe-S-cluster containining protein